MFTAFALMHITGVSYFRPQVIANAESGTCDMCQEVEQNIFVMEVEKGFVVKFLNSTFQMGNNQIQPA